LLEAAAGGAGGGEGEGLLLSTMDEQLDVLARVLHASEAETGTEELPEDQDAMDGGGKGENRTAHTGKRIVGSMAALSGAVGMKYVEFSVQGRGGGRGRRGGGGGSKSRGFAKLAKLRKLQ